MLTEEPGTGRWTCTLAWIVGDEVTSGGGAESPGARFARLATSAAAWPAARLESTLLTAVSAAELLAPTATLLKADTMLLPALPVMLMLPEATELSTLSTESVISGSVRLAELATAAMTLAAFSTLAADRAGASLFGAVRTLIVASRDAPASADSEAVALLEKRPLSAESAEVCTFTDTVPFPTTARTSAAALLAPSEVVAPPPPDTRLISSDVCALANALPVRLARELVT
jgi:hypothetical protein